MWRGCWRFLLPYRSRSFREHALTLACSCARKKFRASFCHEDLRRVLDAIVHFFQSLYSSEGLKELIRSGGAPLVCTIVFIETGFFVGFFLPGDSLLVTAGIFSALPDGIPLKWLLLPVMLCAIVGDQIGYWIGRSAGAPPSSAAAIFSGLIISTRNMAAVPSSSRASSPSFERSALRSPALRKCLMP